MRRWDDDELELFAEHLRSGLDLAACADLHGRTVEAMYCAGLRHGLIPKEAKPKTHHAEENRRWLDQRLKEAREWRDRNREWTR